MQPTAKGDSVVTVQCLDCVVMSSQVKPLREKCEKSAPDPAMSLALFLNAAAFSPALAPAAHPALVRGPVAVHALCGPDVAPVEMSIGAAKAQALPTSEEWSALFAAATA